MLDHNHVVTLISSFLGDEDGMSSTCMKISPEKTRNGS